MTKTTFGRVSALLVLAGLVGAVPAGAAPPDPGAGVLETMSFEIQSGETTVRIVTSRPVPRFILDLGPAGDPVLSFANVECHLDPRYEPPVSFMGPVRVEAPASGTRGTVTLRFAPRAAVVAGVEQREDGVAIRFLAPRTDSTEAGGDYLVGQGDKLEITVFGHEDLVKTVEVGTGGAVNFPLVGDLKVEGRSVAEIDAELTRRLATEFLVDPEVSVEVREYRSQWVTLMGEVRTPGRYALRQHMRLLDVVAEAGGPTKEAGQEIVVTRYDAKTSEGRQLRVRLDDLLNASVPDANLPLRHGDVIAVSERSVFYIRGEVNRPSAFVLERGMTIMKAIAVAGGLTQYANRKEVQLVRSREGGGQENIAVNLKKIEDGKIEDITVRADDVIIVPRRIF